MAGLKEQSVFEGRAPQAKVNVPCAPVGVITRGKTAVCPLETVWPVRPVTVTEKSKPVAERATETGEATEVDVRVNAPEAGPGVVGSKTTAAVQFAPAARLAVQVFWESVKGAVTESVRLAME